jgi:hypothetical protein
MKRYLERRHVSGGGGGDFYQVRVIELANDEPPPEGAEPVKNQAPLHDWMPEHLLPAEEET